MTKKVIIYARVSTKSQDTQMQLLKLKEYAKNHNLDVVAILEDVWSGKNTGRPNYKQLLQEIHIKSFDILLIWKLDRLSRSLKDLIELWERLNHKWINLVSYDGSIDTTTPTGKMIFNIMWVFAEFQRNLIVENVKAWLEKAKSNWKKLGRPKTNDKVFTQKVLQEAISLKNQWMSYRKIALELNISDYSTLSKRVKKYQLDIENWLSTQTFMTSLLNSSQKLQINY